MEVKPGYKQTEVGVIPEAWDVIPLAGLCRSICDGTHFTPKYVDSGIPFYSVENVTADDFINTKFISAEEHALLIKRCKPERGDILMTRITAGVLGDTRIIDWDVNASIYVSLALLKPDDRVVPEYLYRYSRSTAFVRGVERRGLANATPKKINMRDIGAIPIPVPRSEAEQRAIATALSDVDGLLGGLDRLIAKKRDLKQAAMQQLLTGQTRLPGFHGEWEVKSFGEVAVPRRERIDPRRTGVHDFCIELEHIESGSGQILGSNSTGTQSSLKSVFHPGDVLFGKLRAYLRKYWRATRSGVCSTEIWVLVPREAALTSEFLFQIIQTDDFIDAACNSYGTHMPRSDWNVVKNHELKIPLVPEQTAIATVLTEMDGELAALEQRREKTRALKQAMMQELLTGRTRLV